MFNLVCSIYVVYQNGNKSFRVCAVGWVFPRAKMEQTFQLAIRIESGRPLTLKLRGNSSYSPCRLCNVEDGAEKGDSYIHPIKLERMECSSAQRE